MLGSCSPACDARERRSGGLSAQRVAEALHPGSGCLSLSGLQTFGQRLYQQYTCYTVFFISIEMCQIADVLIRKTRRLSAFQQGFFRCPQLAPAPPSSPESQILPAPNQQMPVPDAVSWVQTMEIWPSQLARGWHWGPSISRLRAEVERASSC